MNNKILVEVKLDKPDKTHYGVKVLSFKKIESMPKEGTARNGQEFAISVSDEEWANPSADKADDHDMKYVVMADSMIDIKEDTICLEFSKDAYGKFVFLFNMNNGAYFRVE